MKSFTTRISAVVVSLLFTASAFAQSKTEQIEELLKLAHEYGKFNGSALVIENSAPIYKKGFGMANFEWGIPNAPDTKHRLGSITKQFTAVLILQLVQEGKLKLDAPLSVYLPDYPKPNADQITAHHLLTHSAGIPNYTSSPKFFREQSRNYYSPADFVKTFSELPLEFKPGEKFAYSNSGYFVLGYLIETLTGKSYETCLQERILSPLGMTDTGFDRSEKIISRRAAGYEKQADEYYNASYIDMNLPYAAGSMYSTVEDLFKWDQALYTDQLLNSSSRELMFARQIPDGKDHYGYGWAILEREGYKPGSKISITEHGGGINGFSTVISRITTDRHLVVLLNNTGNVGLHKLNTAILNILYGKPCQMPRKSLARTLLTTFATQGIKAGQAQYRELKKATMYELLEGEVNAAGYDLLSSGKTAEAIEMFRVNVQEFPASGNAYDSLAEAYLKNGNKDLAIENYKRSVQLDPANENGKQILERLLKK